MRLGPVAQSSGMAGQGGSRHHRDWLQVSQRRTAPKDGRQRRQSCRRLQRGWADRDGAGDRRAFPRGVAIAGSRWATRVAPLRRSSDQGTCRTVPCHPRQRCTCCTPMPSTSSNAATQWSPLMQLAPRGGAARGRKNDRALRLGQGGPRRGAGWCSSHRTGKGRLARVGVPWELKWLR